MTNQDEYYSEHYQLNFGECCVCRKQTKQENIKWCDDCYEKYES